MQRPPSVLHVVENLDRGAVENWLMRMLEHAKKKGVPLDWTFYCTLGEKGSLDDKARELGARVVHSPVPLGRKWAFARALRAELKRGRYDVLYCHHDLVSGLYLLASAGLPFTRRIVHVHNADENLLTPSRWKQRLFRPLLRRTGLMFADRVIGISDHTLDTFLAGRKRRPGRDMVHYYGVNASAFEGTAPDRAAFRRELGLSGDAKILLFGGRLVPEKNPVFTVDVLAALSHIEPGAVAVFAGSGSEEAAIRARAKALGIEDKIHLLGWRDDLPRVMRCADWFILPRPEFPMEGFGLAVVEAQLAGLRLLVSNGIPDDPFLPGARFRRLSLSAPAEDWARAAVELLHEPPPENAREALRASPMDMDRALSLLLEIYQ